ncbi:MULTISPECIES: thioesterase family protein [Prochlorococcus]|uniref:1,4-dihydroxy-2-naphthoyl-CoA hydrolase n=1 Tax=Prochlorococcus marinus (strain SARG / CCMP1375 / SS120) TaxID=167539 RepID=DNCH_PROMA|nr:MULTISPECIES: thioesterase family protein [Prochlorococcus]Q7VE16.1 RecName: Full=1,4-dihydroxy-2-naphthoyl-CoA hydrolase; Short=DHNA-CoA hydrolase; AltName: Full=DHNA-CoA thioesterase [Prochlorococcus marinus subsp. marinus str. CCMP1375]AAP99244.1 Predicted thioesterase [Prochlorococcus marinus subsp. marinus str. CCMP1375]KGG18559.1 hypothetical protein EV08_1806 [Prochlorococcus marinus str. SS2]
MQSKTLQNWLHLQRIVRFGDTDAAGVIHFHQLLRWSHEAWEESLDRYGLKAVDVFPSSLGISTSTSVALPIVHCEADFFLPIGIGDKLNVQLVPVRLNIGSFEVQFTFQRREQNVAVALVRHRSIDSDSRRLCDLPEGIDRWLEASSLHRGVSAI